MTSKERIDFITKYGNVSITPSVLPDPMPDLDIREYLNNVATETYPDNTYALDPDSPPPSGSVSTVNVTDNPYNTYRLTETRDYDKVDAVEIDDDPYNTYGLASKKMVVSSFEKHNESMDAHKELFNLFLSKLYELYEEHGELRVNTLSDERGNKIFANRKVVVNGDVEHPKFIVCSENRNSSYDELVARVEQLENIVRTLVPA